MKFGTLTMKELCGKFLSLLRYMPYIIEEKPKVQRIISCLPVIYKEMIEYGNPRTLEETMRKSNFCYEQNKNRKDNIPAWKGRSYDHKKRGTKFFRNIGSNYRGY